MRAAITGGAGFIGHHLVRGLLAAGHEVAVLDNFSTGRPARLNDVRDRISLVQGDILDPRSLDRALAGCDVVFHEAAIASVARSVAEPRLTTDVNVNGTIEVLLAAARTGARRVVLASSAAVYGIPEILPCSEQQLPDPRSPYGASKLAAEHYLHALGSFHGVATVALRYFNVYGPGQDPRAEYAAVVPRFVEAGLEGTPPIVNGSGEISRDFIHVHDVVQANIFAAAATSPTRLTCNVASGRPTTLTDLLRAVSRAVGRAVEPVLGPERPGDVPHSLADVRLAREALGFEATVELDSGIAGTVDWFRLNASADQARGSSAE